MFTAVKFKHYALFMGGNNSFTVLDEVLIYDIGKHDDF